ncbi:ankyrin repeat protein [Elysia marginata]|uniref:Ankyrin repeat protein n=1 Tax=Elysia marginata TaxID=1093978 RepID=A0AAV4J748_9GAST|nr:ankyrin repeat protein [Elysia marginata]
MDNSKLLRAICVRDINQVRQVLTSGQCTIGRGWTSAEFHPVIQCIKFGYWAGDARGCEILKILLQHGADINVQYRGKNIVIFAAELNHLDCLEFFIKFGADLGFTTQDGETALTIATRKGNADCVKFLAEHVSRETLNQTNNNGNTAVMIAAIHDRILCLRHLIQAGADLDVKDTHGHTALMSAAHVKSADAATLLLDSGACVNTVAEYGETFLEALREEEYERKYGKFKTSKLVLKALHVGLDPTLSRRDRQVLHNMVGSELCNAELRGLVMNGFPPLDLDCGGLVECYWSNYSNSSVQSILGTSSTAISPLTMAFLLARPDVAWYFIANNFFTHSDLMHLCRDNKIRQYLQKEIQYESYEIFYCKKAKQCLEILDFLCGRPHSLHTLALIAISSALSQDLLHDPSDSLKSEESWICRPSFREKVAMLEIPPSLKRELLHQTPLSGLCCNFWDHIPICDGERFTVCQCHECEGDSESDLEDD